MPGTFNGETDTLNHADGKTDEGHDGFNQNIKKKKWAHSKAIGGKLENDSKRKWETNPVTPTGGSWVYLRKMNVFFSSKYLMQENEKKSKGNEFNVEWRSLLQELLLQNDKRHRKQGFKYDLNDKVTLHGQREKEFHFFAKWKHFNARLSVQGREN